MRKNEFQLLAECIRTGQVPDEDVPKIMNENSEFAKWYKQEYGVGVDET